MSEDDIERGKLKFRETARRLGPSARLEIKPLADGNYNVVFTMGGKTSRMDMNDDRFADFANKGMVGADITNRIKSALHEIGALV